MSQTFITRKTGVAAAVTVVVAVVAVAMAFLKPITRHDLPSITQTEAVFTSNNPESIYADDPNDSWNRIFHLLFTRTVKADMSSDFPEAGPFTGSEAMGVTGLRVSTRRFERVELGDRAIEPLYPSFLSSAGALSVLTEPRFSQLREGLTTAISDRNIRPSLARALMQCDVWAAYDIIFRAVNFRTGDDRQSDRCRRIILPRRSSKSCPLCFRLTADGSKSNCYLIARTISIPPTGEPLACLLSRARPPRTERSSSKA